MLYFLPRMLGDSQTVEKNPVCTRDAPERTAGMPTVFVISKDWSLRLAVRSELLHAGVEALGMESVDDLAQALAQGRAPSAVVLDVAGEGAALSAAAPRAALASLARGVPIVVVASRVEPAPPLEGAAAVLYRPVRVGEIVARVRQLLEGQAA